jgi:hypothetical protein
MSDSPYTEEEMMSTPIGERIEAIAKRAEKAVERFIVVHETLHQTVPENVRAVALKFAKIGALMAAHEILSRGPEPIDQTRPEPLCGPS